MSRPSARPRATPPDVRVRAVGPFSAGFVPWQRRPGETVLTVVAKATYALEPELCPLLDEPESIQEVDGFWDDDENRSLHAPSDLALMKPSAEVIVVGHAYAKDARPVSSIVARVAIGSIDKMIETCSQRRFDRDGRLSSQPPAARMPLHYEAAAGGPGTDNPVGIDPTDFGENGSRRVPGVLPPNLEVRPGEHVAIVGFGPIAPHWPPRARLVRPQDAAWLTNPLDRAMPQGFDARYFLVAPADQRAVEPFRADERLILEGLSMHHARLVTNLAGVAPVVGLEGFGAHKPPALVADLLCIDTDRGVATLTFRGHLALEGPLPKGTILVGQASDLEQASAVRSLPAVQTAPSPHLADATAELPRKELLRSAARIEAEKAELETTQLETDPAAVSAAVLPFAPTAGPESRGRAASSSDAALPFRGGDRASSDTTPPPAPARAIDEPSPRSRAEPATPKTASSPPPPPVVSSRPSASPPPSSIGASLGPSRPASALPPLRPSAPPAAPSSPGLAPPPPPLVGAPPPVAPPPLLGAPPPSVPAAFSASFATAAQPPSFSSPSAPLPVSPPAAAFPSSASAAPAPPPLAAPLGALGSPLGSSSPVPPPRPSTVGERLGAAPSFSSGEPPAAKTKSDAPRAPEAGGGGGGQGRDAFQMAFRSAATRPEPSETSKVGGPFDSAKEASDAASRAERREREQPKREVAEVAVVRRRALVDLLAFDPALPRRLKRSKAFAEVLADFVPPRVPRRPDEPESDKDRDERGRLDVLRVLSCGVPIDTSDLAGAVERSLDDANDLEIPLFLVAGDLRPTLDEIEALRAGVAVAQPLSGSDKRVGAAVAVAAEALAAPNPPMRQTAVSLLRQIEAATASLSLPPRYVAEQVEHALLTNRRYRKPTILGETRIRTELTSGTGTAYPTYLSDAVASRLPMLTSFPVVALVELHPREDAGETSQDCLVVTAVARVVRTARAPR